MNRNILKVSDRKRSTVLCIAVGFVVSAVISLIITVGMTSLALSGTLAIGAMDIAIFFVRVLSVLVGGLIGAGLHKEKTLMVIGIIAGCYLVLITAVGIVAFDGSVKNLGTGMLSVIVGGAIGCLIRLSAQKKTRYPIRKRG